MTNMTLESSATMSDHRPEPSIPTTNDQQQHAALTESLQDETPSTLRKLVTIRQITSIDPISGADLIELATVDGWNVVVKKDEFAVGSFAVYFEIDSFLPLDHPACEVAWKHMVEKRSQLFEGKRGHRLRTIKIRGQVSQGFLVPVEVLKEWLVGKGEVLDRDVDHAVGLGVVKFDNADIEDEEVLEGGGKPPKRNTFPKFLVKTEQERCQNMGGVIFRNMEWEYEVTMKLDGTSMTVFVDGRHLKEGGAADLATATTSTTTTVTNDDGTTTEVPTQVPTEVITGVCSRNNLLEKAEAKTADTRCHYLHSFENLNLKQALLSYHAQTSRSIAIQGELMGPGIQKNREKLKAYTFYAFDIFDIERSKYLNPEERRKLVKELRDVHGAVMEHVPVMHEMVTLGGLGIADMKGLLKFASGPSIKHKVREGVVFRLANNPSRFSFKAISNEFLLKEE